MNTIEKELSPFGYYHVTLVTIPNLNMKTISREKFISVMKDGLERSTKSYEELTGEPQDNNLRIFFSMCPGPHHGVPGICHGLRNNTSEESLGMAYDILVENEWFLKGTGLKFTYDTCSNRHVQSMHCSSFGIVEVLMSEEDKAAEIAGQKAIDNAIERYYATSSYCED